MTRDSDPLDTLFLGSRRDDLVFRGSDGIVRIFDPLIAAEVEAANTEALYVHDSLIDLIKPRAARARVHWTDVRSALISQNRRLTESHHLKALHERMRAWLVEHADEELDITWIIGEAVAFALIPHIVDGLASTDLRLLKREQEGRLRKFLKSDPASTGLRVANFIRLQRATHVISAEVRRRLKGRAPPREDFLQSLLAFAGELGVKRVTYLATSLLTASSAAPEATAACLVYALYRYPEWRRRIEDEMVALEPEQLYSLPVEKLPATIRFIKEAMRLWPFPFSASRFAARDISVRNVQLRKGDRYELSSFVHHHLDTNWESPESFDPDRWLSPRKSATKGTYVPFGFAPRSCVGGAVAHAQLVLICELFAHSFRVEMSKEANPHLRMLGIALPLDMVGTIRRAACE